MVWQVSGLQLGRNRKRGGSTGPQSPQGRSGPGGGGGSRCGRARRAATAESTAAQPRWDISACQPSPPPPSPRPLPDSVVAAAGI